MEALHLGLFMLSSCVFGVLLEYPGSALNQAIADAFSRRVLMGIGMGLTAFAIMESPFGKRSGAHMNPAVTLTFYMLGKIRGLDAVFYALSQFVGALLGVYVSRVLIGSPLEDMSVNYVITAPGAGVGQAFLGELLISMVLMLTVLTVSNSTRLSRWTPVFAGGLVALWITIEAPISGMSMNPARTLGSAFAADSYRSLWIYFIAPPLGMLSAAALYRMRFGDLNAR